MTLTGHEKLVKSFTRLADAGRLSHGYIFFGEAQIGKMTFARRFANYLEFGEFGEPDKYLSETLLISPDEKGIIGIDEARKIKYFLSEKAINSKYRAVVVDNAQVLTPHAQSAILKITEEPPQSALIILILYNPESLLPTLQSRFQKIYFPRASDEVVQKFLIRELKLSKDKALEISKISFGRIGRAADAVNDEKFQIMRLEAVKLLDNKISRKEVIAGISDDKEKISRFLSHIIAQLSADKIKNYSSLKSILRRQTAMSQFNTNKRLQLESALWNI